MADKSKIQWTEATWNPVIGCERVSEGCRHCYAETQAKRIALMHPGSAYGEVLRVRDGKFLPMWNGKAVTMPDRLDQPLRWARPRLIFVNSMSDLFHKDVPFEYIAAVFGVMAASPRHTFQVLTKRPERAVEFFTWLEEQGGRFESVLKRSGGVHAGAASDSMDPRVFVCGHQQRMAADDFNRGPGFLSNQVALPVAMRRDPKPEPARRNIESTTPWPLPNVWLGVSCEDQKAADERIPLLLRCPAAVRWVSAEPLLGPIQFDARSMGCVGHLAESFGNPLLHWIVVGGESGQDARDCHVSWIHDIVAQGARAGVPVFVKQVGARAMEGAAESLEGNHHWRTRHPKGGNMAEWPENLRVRQLPGEA